MKSYRLTLLGATGVTGRQAFDYLATKVPADFKWSIAGRSPDRMAHLMTRVDSGANLPDIQTVDLEDTASVDRMIRDTDVLVHLAGPYATHGEPVFAACIEHGTHYVDIGGETFFLQQMIERYHEEAKDRQVCLIPTAGYESVPFDMLTYLAALETRERLEEGLQNVKIVTSFKAKGATRDRRISGGSMGTMRNILAGDRVNAFNDMSCLLPNTCDRKSVRRRNRVIYKASFDPDVNAWTGPLQPAPFLNVPVILRSAWLFGEVGTGYGDSFRYEDSMTMEFYADTPQRQRGAAEFSARMNAMLSWVMAAPPFLRFPVRKMLDAQGIEPGDGPSEESLPFIDYELRLFARTESGERVTASAEALGHPGYLSTAKVVAEAGLALALDKRSPDQQFGIVTPSTGLGKSFVSRLSAAGVSIDLE